MPEMRTLVCDVCREALSEPAYGEGFANWGAVQGISLDGVSNPVLCPRHLALVAGYVNRLKHGETDGLD